MRSGAHNRRADDICRFSPIKPRIRRFSRVLILLTLGFSFQSFAVVTELTPAKDNTLYEPLPPFNPDSAEANKSNGAGDYLFAGRANTMNNGLRHRALIQFDVAAALPAGATINNVSLRLYLSQTTTTPVITTDVSLHRVTHDWGEGASDASGQEGGGANAEPGDATWLHTFFNTGFWQQPGGDIVPTPSSLTPVADRNLFYIWSAPGMVADVQFWVDNPAQNFGWLLLGDESTVATAKRFDSADSFSFDIETGQRTIPILAVDFTPVPEPRIIVLLLPGLGCLLFRAGRERLRKFAPKTNCHE